MRELHRIESYTIMDDYKNEEMKEEEKENIHDANIINKNAPQIDSFMKGIKSRHRIEVRLKRRKPMKEFCIGIRDAFYRCFVNCGIRKQAAIDIKPPPHRYIYWGISYDNKGNIHHDNQQTTKPPHLEQEDTEDGFEDGSKFVSNYISTTKYTVLTFLPINLFEQFRKVYNI